MSGTMSRLTSFKVSSNSSSFADGIVEVYNEWFAPTEGILVDSTYPGFESGALHGYHLFGDMGSTEEYDDGFDKLAMHDLNDDGWISGEELDGLALWVDSNTNARLDPDEVITLESVNVEKLHLNHDENFISYAVLKDGTNMTTQDLWFSRR